MGVLTDEPQRAKQNYNPAGGMTLLKNLISMKKIERITFTFCYLFTLVSVVRMCVALVSNLELTFINVAQIVVLFGGLIFLFCIAGVLLFSKRN